MFKWISRLLFGITISTIAIVVTVVFVLNQFIDPTQFKPIIEKQLEKQLGKKVIIEGDLNWSFLIGFGVKLNHVKILNPSGFQDPVFADLIRVKPSISLRALLQRKIEITALDIIKINIHLIKTKEGKVNWQRQSKEQVISSIPISNVNHPNLLKQVSTTQISTTSVANVQIDHHKSITTILKSINIENANFTYTDEQANKEYSIKQVKLHAKYIQNPQHSSIKMDVDLPIQKKYQFAHIKIKIEPAIEENTIELNLRKQIVQYGDTIISIPLKGIVTVFNITQKPKIIAHIHLDQFDLTKIILALEIKNIKKITNDSFDMDYSWVSNQHFVNIKCQLKNLTIKKTNISNIHFAANYQPDNIYIDINNADVSQGKLMSHVQINLTEIPSLSVTANVQNVALGSLLFRGDTTKPSLRGRISANLQLLFTDIKKHKLLEHISGGIKFTVANGSISGLDLEALKDKSFSLSTKIKLPTHDSVQKQFNSFSGNLLIQNGLVNVKNLELI